MWCDGEEPGSGDGVEGLWVLVGWFMGFGVDAWCVRSFGGRRGCWRPWERRFSSRCECEKMSTREFWVLYNCLSYDVAPLDFRDVLGLLGYARE